MKADIRSSASFLKPRAPGLSCTDPGFHRSMQQHAFLWCISESLDRVLVLGRNHCTGLSIATVMIHCELLPILILFSIEDDKEPLAFSSSSQNLQLAPRNIASFLKPWASGLPCKDDASASGLILRLAHVAPCSVQQHVGKDIHVKNVCPIMCLILTWKCKKTFQASWGIFSRMKEAVGFIATASSGIWYDCCYTMYRIKFYWPYWYQVRYFHAPREHEHLPKPPLMWVQEVVS